MGLGLLVPVLSVYRLDDTYNPRLSAVRVHVREFHDFVSHPSRYCVHFSGEDTKSLARLQSAQLSIRAISGYCPLFRQRRKLFSFHAYRSCNAIRTTYSKQPIRPVRCYGLLRLRIAGPDCYQHRVHQAALPAGYTRRGSARHCNLFASSPRISVSQHGAI